MADRVEAQTTLEALRDELLIRRARVAAHGRDGVPADSEDQAIARENDEVVAALAVQIDNELSEISAALKRLEQGHYGNCVSCGEAIATARLAALPSTAHCTGCAK